MDDGVEFRHARSGFKLVKPRERVHRVEHHARIGDVGDDVGHARQAKRLEVEIDDLVALSDEIGNDLAARLAGTASE